VADPRELVNLLTQWATDQHWIDWLELGGSLGRGAGDEWSDIDAGIGIVDGDDLDARRDEALQACTKFAAPAGTLSQSWHHGWHCIVAYADGRQLSLTVSPADYRSGLPPQSRSLLDRSGRHATELAADRWAADQQTQDEWAFLAWIAIGDAGRHAVRGRRWRALRALTEARDLGWQLWAVDSGVTFPAFGLVSVENADLPAPAGMAATHPRSLEIVDLLNAIDAMAAVLSAIRPTHVDLAESVLQRLRALRASTCDQQAEVTS
jgi:hypothetical protein